MKVYCPRCHNEWDYKGKSKYYACCSSCKASVKLEEIPIKKRVVGVKPTPLMLSDKQFAKEVKFAKGEKRNG